MTITHPPTHPAPPADGTGPFPGHHHRPSPRGNLILLTTLATWVVVTISLAATDWFMTDDDGTPWRVIVAAAVPLAIFVVVFRQGPARDHLLANDPRVVLSVQLWRVIGIAFLFGWALDDLDAGFAVPAGVGDVAVGVAAFITLAMLLLGNLERWHVIALTALGIGDFLVAVLAGGVLVQPDNLEQLRWVLFPTLAVPFFTMAHIVTWTQLVGRRPLSRAPFGSRFL